MIDESKKASIELKHYDDDEQEGAESKYLRFECYGLELFVDVNQYPDGKRKVWMGVAIAGTVDEGISLGIVPKDGRMHLDIDLQGGYRETKSRTYDEWLKLESLEQALKIVGASLK